MSDTFTDFRLVLADGDCRLQEATPAEDGKPALRTFSMTAYTGAAVRVPEFNYPIVFDLAGIEKPTKSRPVLRDHDPSKVVGHTTAVEINAVLSVAGLVSGSNEHAREIVESSDAGFPWQVSMGGKYGRVELIAKNKTVNVNGQSFEGPIYVARLTRLGEVSFVALGADDNTSATVPVAAAYTPVSKGRIPMNEFDKWLAENGFDPEKIDDKQKGILKLSYDQAGQQQASLDDVINASKTEQARQNDIARLAGMALKDHPQRTNEIETLARLAITSKWEKDRFELEVLRLQSLRPTPTFQTADDIPQDSVFEAALCLTGGLKDAEKRFRPEVLEEAHERFPHGLSLGQVLLTGARANGYRGMNLHDTKAILEATFRTGASGGFRLGAFSTINVPGILGNTANKFLGQGFNKVDQSWRQVTRIGSAKDFKEQKEYALGGDLISEKVGPTGELKHGSLSETAYSARLDTYGKVLGASRQDIINDDLNSFSQLPDLMGLGFGRALAIDFWKKFLANSLFFTSGQNNYFSGTSNPDTRLSLDGLSYAEQKFMDQTDPDGNPLGINPAIVLVPTALGPTAKSLYNSTEIRDTTANQKFPTANPHAGKYRPVVSPYLSNAVVSPTGYSVTAWYLLADPVELAVMKTSFLNGKDTPTIETAEADFMNLGILMRVWGDFVNALLEYRAGIKMKGSN